MILRPATPADAAALGTLHIAAMRTLAFLPELHTAEEAVGWMAGTVLPTLEVQVAQADDGLVLGYVACREGWIEQLFVHPEAQGRGVGAALLAFVLGQGTPRQLWTFQANARARGFYERRGFRAVEFTDGEGNEERTPDVRYVWEP